MKILKGQLLLLLFVYIRNSACAVETVYRIGGAIWKLHWIIDEIISRNMEDAENLPSAYYVLNQIRNQMDEIHKQLDQVEKFMYPKIIHASFKSSPFSTMIFKCIDTLEIFVSSIDVYYKDFRQHMNETSSQSDTLQGFLRTIIPNIEDRIQVIRRNAIDKNQFLPDHPNLISAITDYAMTHEIGLCENSQTISYTLLQLFRIIMIAEMKANIMFTINRIYQFPVIAGTAGWIFIYNKEKFEWQFRAYVNLFALSMQLTDGIHLRACDPIGDNWIRDKSFYELEGTFQTAIFNYDRLKCYHDSCNDVWPKKECVSQYYDNRSGCSGALTECADLGAMQTCILSNGYHKFRYVNSSKIGLLGEEYNCPENNGYMIVDGIGLHPPYAACICNCYTSDNKISFSLMKSDTESNMVITGVRFIRQNGILHIQPREGKLDADGHIHRYSQRWVSIPDIKSIPKFRIQPINRANRVFFLDDLYLPEGFVIIALKFSTLMRGGVTGFAITIFGVPFDYHSGKLNIEPQLMIIRQPLDERPRQSLSFRARSSVHTKGPNIPSPTNSNYVSLEQSELRDDIGQSTVPFFDSIPIITEPPSPLGGVGIFHKALEGYAGFISLRVYGIKYAKYFTDFETNCMQSSTLFNHTCSFS